MAMMNTTTSNTNSNLVSSSNASLHSIGSIHAAASSGGMMDEVTRNAQEQAELQLLLGPKPKRPLSAYNLFFRSERQKMLTVLPTRAEGKPTRSHGKCGFSDMAKMIAKKWNEEDIDPAEKVVFDHIAEQERARYQHEMEDYKNRRTAIFGIQKKKTAKKAACKKQAPVKKCHTVKAPFPSTSTSSVVVVSAAAQAAALLLQRHAEHSMNFSIRTFCPNAVVESSSRPPAPTSPQQHQYLFPAGQQLFQGIDELAEKLGEEDVDFLIEAFS